MMKNTFKAMTAVLLLSFSSSAFCISDNQVSDKKKTDLKLYLTAKEAGAMLSANSKNILFVDIRTRAEVNFLGMPTQADANIPYFTPSDSWSDFDAKKGNFKLIPNSNFLTAVEDRLNKKGLNKDSKIFVMCRSGHRSAKAANLLAKAGYTHVYTVVDGFEGDKAKDGTHKGERVVNGWKNSGLAWSYKLDKEKMYFDF